MKRYLSAAVVTNPGRIRSKNEDNFFLAGQWKQDLGLQEYAAQFEGKDIRVVFAVADGMGGQDDGEVASQIAVKSLQGCAFRKTKHIAEEYIRQANNEICMQSQHYEGREMGTTVAALYVDAGMAMSCNVGDSRVYLFREGSLLQLSTDHSHDKLLISMGVKSKEQSRRRSHLLTQNLGIPEEEMQIQPSFSKPLALEQGDIFLLCTDGLTDMVTELQICEILSLGTAEQQADCLVRKALENGGADNVTVMTLHVGGRSLF